MQQCCKKSFFEHNTLKESWPFLILLCLLQSYKIVKTSFSANKQTETITDTPQSIPLHCKHFYSAAELPKRYENCVTCSKLKWIPFWQPPSWIWTGFSFDCYRTVFSFICRSISKRSVLEYVASNTVWITKYVVVTWCVLMNCAFKKIILQNKILHKYYLWILSLKFRLNHKNAFFCDKTG